MLRRLVTALLLTVSLFIGGCRSSERPDVTIPFELLDADIATEIRAAMNNRGLWYEDIDETMVIVGYPVPDWLSSLYMKRLGEVLPQGRSVNYSPEVHAKLIPEMKRLGVEFEVVVLGGEEWVVCAVDSCDQIRQMVQEISATLFEERDAVLP